MKTFKFNISAEVAADLKSALTDTGVYIILENDMGLWFPFRVETGNNLIPVSGEEARQVFETARETETKFKCPDCGAKLRSLVSVCKCKSDYLVF